MTAAGPVPAVTLTTVAWDHPDATVLRDAQQSEMRELYRDDDEPVPLVDTSGIVGIVLLHVGADPVGCGALRRLEQGYWGDGEPGPGTGELKRLFVRPRWRGRGLSRLVLTELERLARAHGLRRLVLETGGLQTAAIGLYTNAGYAPIPRYGGYADVELSRCFAKDLDGHRPRAGA